MKIQIDGEAEFPYLLTFSGTRPDTNTTQWRVLRRTEAIGNKRKSLAAHERRVILGDTERICYRGDVHTSATNDASLPCRYLVGVAVGDKLRLHDTSIVHMKSTVKALQQQQQANPADALALEGAQARRDLGETFGTRKAKQAIRSYERGQIDVSTLSGVSGHIQDMIDEKSVHLPTPDALEASAQEDRNIPPFDADTPVVECAFPIEHLVPSDEAKFVPLDSFMAYKKKDFMALKQSGLYPQFVVERLELAVRQKEYERVLRLLFLTFMMKFRDLNEGQLNRRKCIREALMHAPPATMDRLLAMFTEAHPDREGSSEFKRHKMPAILRDKLTAYICALCLHIDGFSVVVSTLAKDMGLTVSKCTDVFKQLGCTMESANLNGATVRQARLTAPLQFPKPPRRRTLK